MGEVKVRKRDPKFYVHRGDSNDLSAWLKEQGVDHSIKVSAHIAQVKVRNPGAYEGVDPLQVKIDICSDGSSNIVYVGDVVRVNLNNTVDVLNRYVFDAEYEIIPNDGEAVLD